MSSQSDIDDKIQNAVEKVLSRNIDGLKHLDGLALDLGVTPKDIIYSRGSMKLYHYHPVCDEIYRVPIVLVMSLINRYYIVDLAPGQSFVEYLVAQGFDVYLIDWGLPRQEHKHFTFDDYVDDFLPDCLDKVAEDCGEDEVSLIGYCLGGVIAALYTALHPDKNIKNLVAIATPVNTEGMPLYKSWADNQTFDIDQIVDQLGNIPGGMVDSMLQALRPLQKTAGRMQLLDNAGDDKFLEAHYRFERWTADQVPITGEAARQLFQDFLRDNKLVKGQMEISGKQAKLENILASCLHITAVHDHIVPTAASKELVEMVGSEDKSEISLKGGHVSLIAGGNAVFRLWPQVAEWLAERSL
ncbi:MAG: poly-beta-hydroxybutyrate polymerase [Gammaproteobacteria bacterium]|nr:MAG: poly-beta-hydroxybutyrate polymerase [Gammaproteobacteria bacterium]